LSAPGPRAATVPNGIGNPPTDLDRDGLPRYGPGRGGRHGHCSLGGRGSLALAWQAWAAIIMSHDDPSPSHELGA
jgi:hypothetical protein